MLTSNGTTSTGAAPQPAQSLAGFIWKNAEILRNDYKPADYGTVILPFTVLRRLDCVLEKTKPAVLEAAKGIKDLDHLPPNAEIRLQRAAKLKFFNTSPFDFKKILDNPNALRANLEHYVAYFSPNVRDIFERFDILNKIAKLDEKDLLFHIVRNFSAVDLHPGKVSNSDMGTVFEELIRRFADASNETAGDHFTPRDAIRLMVDLLLTGDRDLFSSPLPLRTIYDPTAGTGGMLSIAEERIKEYKTNAEVKVFAQEVNDESYAICKGDMLIKGQDVSNIKLGNTLANDAFTNQKFDYMLSNPPYGVDWKKVEAEVKREHERQGFNGRFGPGTPRISDGQMLFLLHLVSKMRPVEEGGSRIAIVMNGSPLFSGGAGSGESEIRKYVIENDWVEAIVALPTEMFYNTGIATYVWILTNKKSRARRGVVQLINAVDFYQKMRKSLGSKRRELSAGDIEKAVQLYGAFEEGEFSRILPNDAFGYRTITIERPLRLSFQATEERLALLDAESALAKNGLPLADLKKALRTIDSEKIYKNRGDFLKTLDAVLKKAQLTLKPPQHKAVVQVLSERDETAEICTDSKRRPEPDSELRDTENVPLAEDIHAYFEREVKPFVADAWVDESKSKIGYEIPFTRHFYKYVPPRQLKDIDEDLKEVTAQIVALLTEAAVS